MSQASARPAPGTLPYELLLYVVQREFHRPMDAGSVPGVISFAKGANVKGFMDARAAADGYLANSVKLLPR